MNRTAPARLRPLRAFAVALTTALLALPTGLAAQSAADILYRAIELYEQRMEGIDNYTVVQRLEDGPALPEGAGTMYFEKTMIDGRPVFVPRSAAMDSALAMQQRSGALEDAGSMMARLRDQATLQGDESIDGNACWVIHVPDASDLQWGGATGADGPGFTPDALTLAVDQDDYVVRRMEVSGDMEMNGRTSRVTMVSTLGDYRDVDGLLHPFRTEMRMSGMASGSMSPEEREELMENLARAKEQLAQMPEAQRAMAERMMGGQLESMEQMLADDEFVVTTVVEEIRVNTGPPEAGS
jgi:hypothetical protein